MANFNGKPTFEFLQDGFDRAMHRYPESLREFFYLFAGRSARLRIVGRTLADHLPLPFSHLQVSGPNPVPQLTIDLWDERETNIRCQMPSADNGNRWSDITTASPDGRFIGQKLPHTLTCLDRSAEHIVGSITCGDSLFIYERAKPLARPLLEWHNDRDVPIIHAGLVSRDGHGILFAGKSGSGKSTTALACLCGGFDYLSEDYVGLEALPDGSFIGHSLYNSVFLENEHLMRFPQMMRHVIRGRPEEEKSAILLFPLLSGRLEHAVPIRAVVMPCIVSAPRSKLRRASKSQTLLALGVSSLFQIPSRGMRSFQRLAQLVERVPVYQIEIGQDLESIPTCVEELLAKVAQG